MIIFCLKVSCQVCTETFRLPWMLSDVEDNLLYNQHFINQYQWGSHSADPDPRGSHKITFKGLQVDLWVKEEKNIHLFSYFCQMFVLFFFQYSI